MSKTALKVTPPGLFGFKEPRALYLQQVDRVDNPNTVSKAYYRGH